MASGAKGRAFESCVAQRTLHLYDSIKWKPLSKGIQALCQMMYINHGEAILAEYILTNYISKALSRATYEKLEDESYVGRIPGCPGVVAFGASLRLCEEELQSTLEDWVLVALKKGRDLPIIEGIDLNKQISREPLEAM